MHAALNESDIPYRQGGVKRRRWSKKFRVIMEVSGVRCRVYCFSFLKAEHCFVFKANAANPAPNNTGKESWPRGPGFGLPL